MEWTQPHLVFDAITSAAEIMHRLLQAADEDDSAGVGVDREELAGLLPLLDLEDFDRRAGNRALQALVPAVEGSRG